MNKIVEYLNSHMDESLKLHEKLSEEEAETKIQQFKVELSNIDKQFRSQNLVFHQTSTDKAINIFNDGKLKSFAYSPQVFSMFYNYPFKKAGQIKTAQMEVLKNNLAKMGSDPQTKLRVKLLDYFISDNYPKVFLLDKVEDMFRHLGERNGQIIFALDKNKLNLFPKHVYYESFKINDKDKEITYYVHDTDTKVKQQLDDIAYYSHTELISYQDISLECLRYIFFIDCFRVKEIFELKDDGLIKIKSLGSR